MERWYEYLSSLQFAEKKPEAVFYPEKYPTFLKRFPDRKGGVLIEIKEVEVAQEDD
jgi:intein-encoded DNA endonuclease-like protein